MAWADDQGAGTCGSGGTSFSGTTSAQVKLVSGAWGALSAPVTVTSGADKVFPGVAARNGVVTVTYYTRDFAATHNPATCNVKIPDNAPAGVVSIEPTPNSVCLDYAASSSTDGFATERRLTTRRLQPVHQFADGSFIGDYSQAARRARTASCTPRRPTSAADPASPAPTRTCTSPTSPRNPLPACRCPGPVSGAPVPSCSIGAPPDGTGRSIRHRGLSPIRRQCCAGPAAATWLGGPCMTSNLTELAIDLCRSHPLCTADRYALVPATKSPSCSRSHSAQVRKAFLLHVTPQRPSRALTPRARQRVFGLPAYTDGRGMPHQ